MAVPEMVEDDAKLSRGKSTAAAPPSTVAVAELPFENFAISSSASVTVPPPPAAAAAPQADAKYPKSSQGISAGAAAPFPSPSLAFEAEEENSLSASSRREGSRSSEMPETLETFSSPVPPAVPPPFPVLPPAADPAAPTANVPSVAGPTPIVTPVTPSAYTANYLSPSKTEVHMRTPTADVCLRWILVLIAAMFMIQVAVHTWRLIFGQRGTTPEVRYVRLDTCSFFPQNKRLACLVAPFQDMSRSGRPSSLQAFSFFFVRNTRPACYRKKKCFTLSSVTRLQKS